MVASIEQFLRDGVSHQIGIAFHAKLFHQVRLVRGYCLRREI
jgi:hypothetical protein